MIKRILVALDPDEDTPVATRYSATLAQRFEAEVSGLAIVDTRPLAVEVDAGGSLGGLYFAEQTRNHTPDTTPATARDLTQAFRVSLERQQIRHRTQVEEGVPYQQIIDAMKYHDLLVIGKASHFYYRRPEWKTDTLAQVVKRVGAPTLVVGSEYRSVERVLLAYDGSDAAARTIQRFAQLQPFGTAPDLELVHVCEADTARARLASERHLRLMRSFLQAHGFMLITATRLDGKTPKTRLLDYATETHADLIVAGAHAVSAMRRAAFGSTTYTLLKGCTVPLFLFH